MRFRPPLSRLQLLFAVAASVTVFAGATSTALAQHRIIGKPNAPQNMQRVEGEIVRATKDSVVIRINANEFGIPKQFINEVQMPAPREYDAAIKAYEAGDYAKALPAMKGIVDKFKGLPTPWAIQATTAIGDIYVGVKDLKNAAAAYNDLRTFYPEVKSPLGDVGMAKVALAGKDIGKAKTLIQPILAKALEAKSFSSAEGAAFGQAFLLNGQILEEEKKYPEALQDYLRTVTIFYQDTAATNEAARKADALKAAQKDVVVP